MKLKGDNSEYLRRSTTARVQTINTRFPHWTVKSASLAQRLMHADFCDCNLTIYTLCKGSISYKPMFPGCTEHWILKEAVWKLLHHSVAYL